MVTTQCLPQSISVLCAAGCLAADAGPLLVHFDWPYLIYIEDSCNLFVVANRSSVYFPGSGIRLYFKIK